MVGQDPAGCNRWWRVLRQRPNFAISCEALGTPQNNQGPRLGLYKSQRLAKSYAFGILREIGVVVRITILQGRRPAFVKCLAFLQSYYSFSTLTFGVP